MDISHLAILCIVINLSGVFLSAYLWNKRPKFRKLSILSSTLSGLVYTAINPSIIGVIEMLKVVSVFFLIGVVFYFTVWIQCREKSDSLF
jgi:uncharacterized membrane protein HdeD (DUF308 family)